MAVRRQRTLLLPVEEEDGFCFTICVIRGCIIASRFGGMLRPSREIECRNATMLETGNNITITTTINKCIYKKFLLIRDGALLKLSS